MTNFRATGLRCEALTNPMGVDEKTPLLSWWIEANGHDRAQSAYRLIVASTEEALAQQSPLIWDSGRLQSDQTLHVPYGGPRLEPLTRYWWAVEVWDETGQAHGLSDPAYWETGWLGRPWPGEWISRPPLGPDGVPDPGQPDPYVNGYQSSPVSHLRRRFDLRAPVRRARLYATALGVLEARLNGQRIGEDRLAPGWTDYHQRLEVHTYDVKGLLHAGSNVLGALLGEGWYAGYIGFFKHKLAKHYGDQPAFRAVLRIEYENGQVDCITTDAQWRHNVGPWIYSDLLHGECYDARLSLPGWDLPHYDDTDWRIPSTHVKSNAVLEATRSPSIRITQQLPARSVTASPDGAWVFDFGQNMVGHCRLLLRQPPAGLRISLTHGEMLDNLGNIYVANLRSTRQEDIYIARGDAEESYEPLFTVHGFRYVALRGLNEAPPLDTLIGQVVHNDLPNVGEFDCSHPLLNRLQQNILWSQRGNFLAVPTDCPQRDERCGWTADAQVFARTAAYQMDLEAFFGKWMQDILDAQTPEGIFQCIAPSAPIPLGGAPAWGDAGVILPVLLFETYGNKRLLRRCWPAMQAWMSFLERHNPSGIRDQQLFRNWGDWLADDAPTPKVLLATAYYAWTAKLMAQAAQALGLDDEVAHYRSLFEHVRKAFQRAYVSPDGRVSGETQTGYLLALFAELLPDNLVAPALAHLIDNICARGHRLSTGFIGVRHLCPILTEHGHAELAHELATSEDYPSWGYSIQHGATTIWERWDGWTKERGFQTPQMNSFNHYALGSVGEWLFEWLAGIGDDHSGKAFKRIVLRPTPSSKVSHCRARYLSPRGWIESRWQTYETGTVYEVSIPANCTAVLEVISTADRVSLDGQHITAERSTSDKSRVVIHLGSGRHRVETAEHWFSERTKVQREARLA